MDLSAPAPKYCLLKTIRRWPYKKTSKASQAVLKRFFDKEPFFNRPWDIYVAQSPDSGSLGGIVVPFTQVKAFFEQTQSETDVMLSTRDRDLIFDPNGSSEFVIHFVGTSQSWNSYEAISNTLVGQDFQAPVPTNRQSKQAKNARSERKKQAQLQNRLNMLKSAAEIVNGKQDYAFISIDIESWEKNHDIITELGLSLYVSNAEHTNLDETGYHITSDHIIVKEHRSFKNGDYVADASGNFEFGKSRYVPLAELQATVASFMEAARTLPQADELKDSKTSKNRSPETTTNSQRQLVLVGHDVNADIEYLRKLGYNSELTQFTIIFDTMEMWKGIADTPNGISLTKLCNELGIVAWNVHNAGNDARYTLNAFLAMAKIWQNKPGDLQPVGMDGTG
ncbi:hypothetical protein TWF696_008193 [Orbilia brochopaga]|uniref:Gfd2/YDR514C-like C-terminal domain-containing protein n=1 Tax=Orbilia brochopaga TaxID=3140254 RepID=A0AAV9UMG6_9PEZI